MKIGKLTEKVVKFIPLVFILLLLINVVSVSAITGSLGNARMVIRAKAGDTIEKYVLVKNVNEEEIKIGLKPSGDLAEYIKLKETEFDLGAGEDKKAYFTIKVPTNGTTESRIEVTFAKADGKGNGVGLASTIIVVAEEGESLNLFGNFDKKTISIIAGVIIALIFIVILITYLRKNKFKKSDEAK